LAYTPRLRASRFSAWISFKSRDSMNDQSFYLLFVHICYLSIFVFVLVLLRELVLCAINNKSSSHYDEHKENYVKNNNRVHIELSSSNYNCIARN
jgi:hypothetical protein